MDIQKNHGEGEDQIDDRLLNDVEHKIVVGIFGILLSVGLTAMILILLQNVVLKSDLASSGG